jgi:hypothetical protein
MNKELVARKLRESLENRIAGILDCQPSDLSQLKLGALIHLLFMLRGNSEDVGGFSTTIHAVLDLVGNEIVWKLPEDDQPAEEAANVVVN